MFKKLLEFLKSLPHKVLPNPDWKKIAWSAGCGVASFFVLKYLLPVVFSVGVVALVGACAVGYLVYSKVAMWEIERVVKAVHDLPGQVKTGVDKIVK